MITNFYKLNMMVR